MKLRATFLMLITLSTFVRPSIAKVALGLVVSARDVTVTGLTPGGSAVLLNVARVVSERHIALVSQRVLVTDASRTGAVSRPLPSNPPLRSLWVAIDAETGETAAGGPEGYPVRNISFPAGAIRKKDAAAEIDQLILDRQSLQLAIIRPGEGSWFITASDGGLHDLDKNCNGGIDLDLSAATAISGSAPAPTKFKNRDVLVAFDTAQMEVLVVTIGMDAK